MWDHRRSGPIKSTSTIQTYKYDYTSTTQIYRSLVSGRASRRNFESKFLRRSLVSGRASSPRDERLDSLGVRGARRHRPREGDDESRSPRRVEEIPTEFLRAEKFRIEISPTRLVEATYSYKYNKYDTSGRYAIDAGGDKPTVSSRFYTMKYSMTM